MSSRFFVGAAALAIILAVGQASAAAQDQSFKAAGKPQKGGTGKLAIPVQPTPLGGRSRACSRSAASSTRAARGGSGYVGRRGQGHRRRCAR